MSRRPRCTPGRIVVLNGCSSAGKSTLAATLQRGAPDLQLLHLQLDAFRAMEPPEYFGAAWRAQAAVRAAALCRAINAAAREFCRHGQSVLVDHVLAPHAWAHVLQDLAPRHTLLVKVHCALDELERRERARGDRPTGLARSQHETIHHGRRYDFELDTGRCTAAQAAQQLEAWLRTAPRPQALGAMRAQR